jgi:hypothetical protein
VPAVEVIRLVTFTPEVILDETYRSPAKRFTSLESTVTLYIFDIAEDVAVPIGFTTDAYVAVRAELNFATNPTTSVPELSKGKLIVFDACSCAAPAVAGAL